MPRRLAAALLVAVAASARAEAPLPPDPEIHALRALARRGHVRPFDKVAPKEGAWPSERVVFRDVATGTVVWRMSGNPGINRHDAMRSPWNADGSLLALNGMRGDRGGVWLARTDGSGWTWFGWGWSGWSADEPDIAFVMDPGAHELQRANVRTGERTAIWKLPFERGNLCRPSPDGMRLLVVETPQDRDAAETSAWIVDPAGKEEAARFRLDGLVQQAWFLKRPDGAFVVCYERPATRPDRDGMFLCEPAKDGAIRVLDPARFQNGVPSPSGKQVAFVRRDLMLLDVGRGESRILARLATDRGAWLAWDCDDSWLAACIGNQIAVVNAASGKIDPLCVPNALLGYGAWGAEAQPSASPDGTKIGFASGMLGDLDFYVAVKRLPDPPREVSRKGEELTWKAPLRCRELAGYRVWKDGKPVSRELVRGTGCRADLGGNYAVTAVEHSGLESEHADAAAPRAPAGVEAAALDAWTLEVSWEAAEEPDLAYYNVYCGPGADRRAAAARVASTPATRHVEWGLAAGQDVPVAVTAVDSAGNESAASAVAKVKLPKAPAFHKAIPVGKRAPVDVTVTLDRNADAVVWVCLRQVRAGPPPPVRASVDGDPPRNWQARWDLVGGLPPGTDAPPFWDLLPGPRGGSPLQTLMDGEHRISISAPDGQVEVLSVIVTADQAFVPDGITSYLARKPK